MGQELCFVKIWIGQGLVEREPGLTRCCLYETSVFLRSQCAGILLKGGKRPPTPKISALLRKRPVFLSASFVLTEDRKRPYYGHFCGKNTERPGVLSKVQMLNLVLGVGVFSLLPILGPIWKDLCVQKRPFVCILQNFLFLASRMPVFVV